MDTGTSKIAFGLSLAGGILIVLGGVVSFFWSTYGTFWYGMMGNFMMGGSGYVASIMFGFSLVALISGILVLVGAIILNARPQQHMSWGIVVLVFSAISFIGMGGFIIGAVLGIVGGALAIA